MQAQVLETAGALLASFALVSVMASAAVELVSALFKKRSKDLRIAIEALTKPRGDGAIDIQRTSTWATLSMASRRKRGVGKRYDDRTPSYMSARAFGEAVAEEIRRLRQVGESVTDVVERLPPSVLQRRLADLVAETGGDMVLLRAGVEHWFDDAMDRLQGGYKRWSQLFLVVFGLGFAAALNISAFRIVDSVWNDATLRAAYTSSIDKLATCPDGKDSCDPAEEIQSAIKSAQDLALPIGWRDGWDRETGKLVTLLGIIPTGLAAMAGAPFWFDLLKRVVGGGGTRGVPPRASDDHASASTAVRRAAEAGTTTAPPPPAAGAAGTDAPAPGIPQP